MFELTDDPFMDTVENVAKDHLIIALYDQHVDTFAVHLVKSPQRFDVVLCTNMFGDILSYQAAGLVGGPGKAPGLSTGGTKAMAQATHGSVPDIAGKSIANPYAMIMTGKMLRDRLGTKHGDERLICAAQHIDDAVERVIAEGKHLTSDLGGDASTEEMSAATVAACGEK